MSGKCTSWERKKKNHSSILFFQCSLSKTMLLLLLLMLAEAYDPPSFSSISSSCSVSFRGLFSRVCSNLATCRMKEFANGQNKLGLQYLILYHQPGAGFQRTSTYIYLRVYAYIQTMLLSCRFKQRPSSLCTEVTFSVFQLHT